MENDAQSRQVHSFVVHISLAADTTSEIRCIAGKQSSNIDEFMNEKRKKTAIETSLHSLDPMYYLLTWKVRLFDRKRKVAQMP